MNPTEIRDLGNTARFCLHDLKAAPVETVVRITAELNRVMEPSGVRIHYVNIVDLDAASIGYNPDGYLGHFSVIQTR